MPNETPSFPIPILCGVLPLIAGLTTFGIWYLTRSHALVFVGALVLGVGVLLWLWGALVYALQRRRRHTWDDAARARASVALWLLVLAWPAGLACAGTAAYIITSYRLDVVNETGHAIASCRVAAPGVDLELGPLAPGESAGDRFAFAGDGPLTCRVRHDDGAEESIVVEGYVTNSQGGGAIVRFAPGGVENVENHRR